MFPSAFGFFKVDGLLDGAWKTVAFFFVYDFFYYWFHRLQHGWPFLWAQHKLHHSEEALNATTTLRHHWLEDLLRVFFIVLPMSMAFDLKPASAGAAAFVVGAVAGVHPREPAAAPRAAGARASPDRSCHRIHHSVEAHHLDRNLAAFFPLWDQLFGTYYHPRRDEYPRTGLASGQRVTSLAQALWLPFGEWFARGNPAPTPRARRAARRDRRLDAWRSCWVSRVLEVAARIVFPLPAIGNFNRIEYAPTAISPSMRSKHYLMNSTLSWISEPDHAGSTMHLNLYGFRDAQWDVLHKRARRILFVGDSFVEGFMAADDETIPAVFARRARAAGQAVEVFNLGIGATGLSDYMKIDPGRRAGARHRTRSCWCSTPTISPASRRSRRRGSARRSSRATAPLVAAHRAGGRRLIAGEPVALRWHGEAKPFLAAVPDPSNPWTDARSRARAESRPRHRRRDAPRDVQSSRRRRARRIRRISSSGSST